MSALVAIAFGVFVVVPNASAHHSEITASTDCARQVSWTATSWNPGSDNGVNNKVKVWYVVNDGPDAGTTATAGNGKFDSSNSFEFSGMFPWPSAGASTLTVFVQEQVNWGPNQNLAGPASPRSANVTAPTNCPGTPSASSSVQCTDGDGTVTITLTATGGSSPIDFVVTNPVNGQVTNKTVAAGQSTTVVLTGLPDGTHTIAVVGGNTNLNQTVTVACDRPGVPSVDAKVACTGGDGVVTVTIANTGGDKPVTFVVTNPLDQQTTTKTLNPGETATVTISGAPDGQLVIPVTANGKNVDQTVTVKCDRPGVPSVTSGVQCTSGDGVVTVTLANTGGDKPVTFVVTNPLTQRTTQKVVAPGQSTTVIISGVPDGQITVPVTADGAAIDQHLTVNCDRPGVPSVSSSVACTSGDGEVTITLANSGGDLPITFTVTDPRNNATTTKTVAAGQSETVTLTKFSDGTYTIPVSAGGTNLDQTLTVKCDVPGVASLSLSHECQNFDGTATITLGNTGGTEPIRFVVTNPVTGKATTVDVPVGGSHTVTIPGLADGTVTIPVTADGKVMNQTFTVQCDHPGTPSVSQNAECTATGGKVTITVANSSAAGTAEPIEFVVTNPIDGKTTAVTVAAGSSSTVVFADMPEGDYDVAISADGVALTPVAVTVNCQEPKVISIVLSCDHGGAVVTLGNTGGTPSTLVVQLDGQTVATVTVPPNGTIDVHVTLTEDQPAVITVLDGTTKVDEQTVTLHCTQPTTSTTAPPTTVPSTSTPPTTGGEPTTTVPGGESPTSVPATVLGIQEERTPPAEVSPQTTTAGTLPVTGMRTELFVVLGGLLLIAGVCLVAAARQED